MVRKGFVLALLALVCLLTSDRALGPSRAADKEKAKPGYVHVVIFHVKKDAPKGEAEELVKDAHEMLAKIESVRDLKTGRPAEKSTPNLAKKDYDVGLLVMFDDAEGLETYLKHPQHTKFVEKHEPRIDMENLQVYDFADSAK